MVHCTEISALLLLFHVSALTTHLYRALIVAHRPSSIIDESRFKVFLEKEISNSYGFSPYLPLKHHPPDSIFDKAGNENTSSNFLSSLPPSDPLAGSLS